MSTSDDLPAVTGRTTGARLYELTPGPATRQTSLLEGLQVERFAYRDQLSQGFVMEIHVLSTRADHPVSRLIGEPMQLRTRLADGQAHVRSALLTAAACLGSDGGFTRYRLILTPWVHQLHHRRHSRVWQDKPLTTIVDELLAPYRPLAAWRWGEEGDDLAGHLARGPRGGVLPFSVQYRESDWAFMQRLLAQHGLGWRVEAIDTGADTDREVGAEVGHRLVFFSDSRLTPEDTVSASGAGGEGIRFHRAGPTESQDTLQALVPQRHLAPMRTTVLAWDVMATQAFTAEADAMVACSASARFTDAAAGWLDHYHPALHATDAPASSGEVQHLAALYQQALDAGAKHWRALGNVRSLCAGRWFAVTQFEQAGARPGDTQQAQDERLRFLALEVQGLAVNNLPQDPRRTPVPFSHTWLQHLNTDTAANHLASSCGHACRVRAQRRSVPWRPSPPGQPTAQGTQTALVVGPGGDTAATAGQEIHTDAAGRLRLRFHWQDGPLADPRADNRLTCWVPMARAWAGPGMGLQRTPRIGDEVIVAFLGNQIHQPVVIGSVPNGQGQAGVPRTPGGVLTEADVSALRLSTDHRPSAQGNLVHNGRSPAWHGGAPGQAATGADAQNNAAALSGFKSREWGAGAQGFNQLVFDDTPQQLRTQLATSQHGTQLSLGHLIHQAGNHRGSFRGLGFELRTDAFGAVRAHQGLLLSTYPATFTEGVPDTPAFDNAPGMALARQAAGLAEAFDDAAKTHQATALASARGSLRPGQSTANPEAPPLKALHTAVSGTASVKGLEPARQDATAHHTAAGGDKLPHATDPIIAIAAKAGLAMLAGQHLQWSTEDVLSLQANRDIHLAVGGQLRWHAAQGIGVLAGAVQPGSTRAAGSGLTFVNGKGPIDIQAQNSNASLCAKTAVDIHSATEHVNWAAAKSITLATAAGARIRIDASGVHSECPGSLTIHALKRSLDGPQSHTDRPAGMPPQVPHTLQYVARDAAGKPLSNVAYAMVMADGSIRSGRTDASGQTQRITTEGVEKVSVFLQSDDHEGFHFTQG